MLTIELNDEVDNIELSIEQKAEELQIETENVVEVATDDYEKLKNKPTLNGETLIGDMRECDPTVPTWAKEENKPSYTPEEVGAVNSDSIITLDEIDALFKGL